MQYSYLYELRRAGVIIVTGRLSVDSPFAVGDEFEADGQRGRIAEIVPLSGNERKLLVELVHRRAF